MAADSGGLTNVGLFSQMTLQIEILNKKYILLMLRHFAGIENAFGVENSYLIP